MQGIKQRPEQLLAQVLAGVNASPHIVESEMGQDDARWQSLYAMTMGFGPPSALRPLGDEPPGGMPLAMAQSSLAGSVPEWVMKVSGLLTPLLILTETLMPPFTQHCAETTAVLGKPFEEVHRWLDEFAGKPPYGMRHRKLRHHLAGIEQVRKLWGDQAAEAARLHIIADLKQEGWTEDQPFPRDEQHYMRMGLF